MAKKEKAGHRQRLRERFLTGEAGSCSDETLLELLLTFAIGRKDVSSLAHELIRVFGSLPQVLSASPDDLYKVKGIGQSSVALLKAVNFIRSSDVSLPTEASAQAGAETRKPIPKGAGPVQQKLFENPLDGQPGPDSESSKPHEAEKPSIPSNQPEKECETSAGSSVADMVRESLPALRAAQQAGRHPSRPSKRTSSAKKSVQPACAEASAGRRKFQVSNGYLLEFDQLARILHFLLEHRDAKKINRKALQEDTGLADRQVESLVSMGSAMGLIKPGLQVLTPVGLLVAEHDIFIEKRGTLEWCHYAGASSYRNLIWFEIFNRLLTEATPMSQEEWNERLRSDLTGKYSKRTIGKGLYEEVRFVVDAYTKRNFSKLELLTQSSDLSAGQAGERLYRRRYTDFAPLVLSAMIYDFCASRESHLSQVGEMAVTPGSPAVVFGLDAASFRQQIEGLHDRGWLRYETTHNLDQIRLKPGFSALEFLTAYFEDREPREASNQSPGGIFE